MPPKRKFIKHTDNSHTFFFIHYISRVEDWRFLFDFALDLIVIAHVSRKCYSGAQNNSQCNIRKLKKMEVQEVYLSLKVSVPVKARGKKVLYKILVERRK